MYVLDGHVAPVECELRGVGERGLVLTLAKVGEEHPSGVNGLKFEYGSTGIYALGNGEGTTSRTMCRRARTAGQARRISIAQTMRKASYWLRA